MLNILVVDDSEIKIERIKLVVHESYSNESLNVIVARNTSDAMTILLSNQEVNLLILDLNLPIRKGEKIKNKSGLNLLKEITRRFDISRPDSIIGLTSYQDIRNQVEARFQDEGWIITTFDLKESNWEEIIKNKISYLMSKKIYTPKTSKTPLVVILTAIKEEYIAVRAHLTNLKDKDIDDTSYEIGEFNLNKKLIANVVIRECGAKNSIAAMETERAISNHSPQLILFVGIAGSRKINDFKIGDVVIPEKIYSYESGKTDKNMFSARPDSGFLSFVFLEKAKKERLKNDWKKLIKGEYKNFSPTADIGIIASGDQLIEHYDSQVGEILNKHYNDTSVVEMEGFGFTKTISKQGRSQNNLITGLIRGVSDLIKQSKDLSCEFDRRPSEAKAMASDTASAFAFWMIYKLYENRGN
ncbi:hypothetical protein A9Q93_06235 [Nonlabens dokdonensis]|uniref:Response regulatory domain-containing protein n=1 Tax=Nonlabens dokdonensis TaxID=328515 RepID=A0A1Z8AZQ2_9FLAO|nr:hypothetical protein [Nonlabens dokdonensis]OUS15800.1 hypothetical protein A9Q93_06235 [Nonlabens dokdonensis]